MLQILVLEPEPCRGPELRLELAAAAVDIYCVSKARELDERLAGDRPTVIVWDTSADLAGMLVWLSRRLLMDVPLTVVACAAPETADLEWTCRGLGVVSWSNGHTPGYELARVCRAVAAVS